MQVTERLKSNLSELRNFNTIVINKRFKLIILQIEVALIYLKTEIVKNSYIQSHIYREVFHQ